MATTLELTTSDLKDLESNSLWLNEQANDEFAFLLDENSLEYITNPTQPQTLSSSILESHNHSDSSEEDEVTFHPYQPSPPSSPSDLHVGSPSSSSSDFSDLSPLLFSADMPTFTLDPNALQDLSSVLQLPFPFATHTDSEVAHMVTDSTEEEEEEEEEDTKKNTKKRRRSQPAKSSNKNFVELEEEKLLQFDSKQMEEYISGITASKSLSHAQLKELKKIRRLIKNREYAQSSRNKKKQYVEEVEKKLNDAHAENAALQQKLNTLEMENKALKYQLTKIGTIIKKDPEIVERIKRLSDSTTPVSVPAKNNKSSVSTKKATTAFSATLFVVLFSVGLFVNFGGKPTDPFSCTSQGGLINKFTAQSSYHTGRVLLHAEKMVEEQPTYFDLFAPAALHNFASYWFPRPVLEEPLASTTLESDSGYRGEQFGLKRNFAVPSQKSSIPQSFSSSSDDTVTPVVSTVVETGIQDSLNYTEILVSGDRSEL